MSKRPSIGIIIIGVFLFLSGMPFATPDQDNFILLKPLPLDWILYSVYLSVFMQAVGVVSGLGIILLKEFFRKTVLVMSAYQVVEALVKMPLIVDNCYEFTKKVGEVTYPSGNCATTLVALVTGLLVKLFLVYYFTRPHVRQQFQDNKT